jgi:quercetin dioxygenase-like cupin family protein
MTIETIRVMMHKDVEGISTGEGEMRPFLFSKNLSLIHLDIPPGLNVTPHSHPSEGYLYCLEGEMELVSEEAIISIQRDAAVIVPAGVPCGIRNVTENPVRCLLISSPPKFASVEAFRSAMEARHG